MDGLWSMRVLNGGSTERFKYDNLSSISAKIFLVMGGPQIKLVGPKDLKRTVLNLKSKRSEKPNPDGLFEYITGTVNISSKERPLWCDHVLWGPVTMNLTRLTHRRFWLIIGDLSKTYRWLWILSPMKSLILTFLPRTVRGCWVTIGATLQMFWTREILKK